MEDSMFQSSSFEQSFKKSKKSKRILLIIIAIVIILIVFFSSKKLLGSKNQKTEKTGITPTPTEYIFPTEAPTITSTPSARLSPVPTKKDTAKTPTPKLTTSPTGKTTTGLDRSALSIEVRNGSGVAGAAGKMSQFLKELGYNVTATGNADNFDYESTVVEIKLSKNKYLDLLKKDLSSDYTVDNASSDLSASSSADAVVIVGK